MKKIVFALICIVLFTTSCAAEAKIDVFALAEHGTPEELQKAVSEGADFHVERNAWDEDFDFEKALFDHGETPLHHAAAYNHNPDSIKFLVSMGLDVEAVGSMGNSYSANPLSCAIEHKNAEAVKALLECGANPNSWCTGGSAFHVIAAEYKDDPSAAKAIVDALVKAGSDVNSHSELTSENISFLNKEVQGGVEVVSSTYGGGIFLPRGQWTSDNPFDNLRDFSHVGRDILLATLTPLMYAVLYDNPDVVNILLEANADPSIHSGENKLAIDYALELPEKSKLKKSAAFEQLSAASPKPSMESIRAAQLEKLVAEKKVPEYVRDKGSFFYDPKFSNIVICGDNVRLRSQPNTKSNILGKESWGMTGTISYLGEWWHPDATQWLVGLYNDGSNLPDAIKPVWVSAQYARAVTQEEYAASGQPELGPNASVQSLLRAELFQPSGKQDMAKIKTLIKAGADINYHVEVPENKKQVIILPDETGEVMQQVFRWDLSMEERLTFFRSCPYITQAALNGRADVIEILLKLGAKANIRNMENKTAFDYIQDNNLPFKSLQGSPAYGRLREATLASQPKTLDRRASHPSGKPQRYIVTNRLVQIGRRNDAPYKELFVPYLDEGWAKMVLAYGDVIEGVESQNGDIKVLAYDVLKGGEPLARNKDIVYHYGSYYEYLVDPSEEDSAKDNITSIGTLDRSALSPMPEYEPFAPSQPFHVDEKTVPCLLPGKFPVSDYSLFALPRGTVIMAEGRTVDEDGASWILCSFRTEDRFGHTEDFGGYWIGDPRQLDYAGSEHRYAWLPEKNLTQLSAYTPDLSRVEERALPDDMEGDARKCLMKNGFYVDPSPLFQGWMMQDDLVDSYLFMGERTPRFITADLPLHVLHLYFDRLLKNVEEEALSPMTKDFVTAMREAFKKLPKETSDLERRARGNISNFLSVAQYLLTGEGNVESMGEFIEKILNGEGWGENPFTERQENFGLFAPRGHYAMSEKLKAYSRTLYLLGTIWPLDSETGAAATLILNKLLDEPNVARCWHSLYDPMKALVGRSNVNSHEDLSEVLKPFTLEDLGNVSRVHDLMEALDQAGKDSTLRKPAGMLSPSDKKFALLPRRVTFDALIFNTLTSPETGTANKPRNLPDPLDVMAVLGSKPARDEVKRYADFRNYEDNLTKLSEIWPSYSESDDGANVYTSVLAALRVYFASGDSKQFFANSPAWGYKKLTTAGAALTELNHDTLFYGERYAIGDGPYEAGCIAGPFKLPIPRGYLEPVPELYSTLGAAAMRLEKVFKSFIPNFEELLNDKYADNNNAFSKYRKFAEEMNTLSAIATRARDDAMTYEDFVVLQNFALPMVLSLQDKLSGLTTYGDDYSEQLRMALVVDTIASFKEDLTKGETPALYTATGTPRKIQVYVNDKSGGWRLTEGYMYSYYTFDQTTAGNINDSTWRARVYNENAGVQEKLKELLPYWHEKMYQ